MSKQIIDHGFGIIETRETFYTEETISKLNQQITELQKQLEEKDADIIALDVDNYSFKQQIDNLRQQLKSQPSEIVEKIKGRFLATCRIEQGNDEMIASFQTFNRCLDTILKEYQK